MAADIKESIADGVTLICLIAMFIFAHGCEWWCIAIYFVCGIVAVVMQNYIKPMEEGGNEYDF